MTATASRIGVGFVGLSASRGWAAQADVPALAILDDRAIRGRVASTPVSAEASARRHDVLFATDRIEARVERDDIDLVVVTPRVPEHRHTVESALRAGKAGFCEWPPARDHDEALALQALAAETGRPCFVGRQGRASPALRAAPGADECAELPVPDRCWPLAGDRDGLACDLALTYAAIARDLRDGSTSAPGVADAVALHRTLVAIRRRAGQPFPPTARHSGARPPHHHPGATPWAD